MATLEPTAGGTTTRRDHSVLALISAVITLIGGLNWGLVGIANFDLVATLFGKGSTLSRIVYVIVALASIFTFMAVLNSAPRRTTMGSTTPRDTIR